MIRWSLFAVLALGVVAYSFWLYLRVELAVPAARWLASARAVTLLVLMVLLFDLRLPSTGAAGVSARWVLLDASLSMTAVGPNGGSAWAEASARADQLEREGWTVVAFGEQTALAGQLDALDPAELGSLLAPALERAAEAGVSEVRVLSDLRLEDAVAVRSTLATLPMDVSVERFGGGLSNAGIASLAVPDLASREGSGTAEVEVYGGNEGDSLTVTVWEEDEPVVEVTVPAPSSGLRRAVSVDLPTPSTAGRVRYAASVTMDGDAFPSDDEVVSYASVGSEEGALVLVSLRGDWEPRFLLPIVAEVTGLTARGYLRAGPDAFIPMGRAIERGGPADSATVGRAVGTAALVVLHGLGADADPWARSLVGQGGPMLLMLTDAGGAAIAGLETGEPRPGEWYVSSEIPASPIAGSLTGVTFEGLPPLRNLLLPSDPSRVRSAVLAQLRGAGPLEAALHLEDRPQGRLAVTMGSGFWRWAARGRGREAYRRLWSGVAGWLVAGQAVPAGEPRPTRWVVGRGDPVTWSLPPDSVSRRITVSSEGTVVVDTAVATGGLAVTGALPPGRYTYNIQGENEEEAVEGRFDVAEATLEMLPPAEEPVADEGLSPAAAEPEVAPGRPVRTSPFPYLLVITLLCAEWIGRRRSGLR